MKSEELDGLEIAALRRLLDRQAITECIVRYARGLDRRDEALIRSAYHADAVEDHGPYVGGVDGLVRYLLKVHESYPGYQRHVTTMNVDVDGDEAHAESYFLSVICPEQRDERLMLAAGRYLDRLQRRDGEWKIATRVVVLEWHGAMEGGAIAGPNGPRLDGDDLSYLRPLTVTRPDRDPTAPR